MWEWSGCYFAWQMPYGSDIVGGRGCLLRAVIVLLVAWLGYVEPACPQTFSLRSESDSLHFLVLATDSTHSEWRLPYPVFRLDTGDVDGDGSVDALVGVVKSTRFDPVVGRRLFVFKNCHGYVRPLWLGSRLGGQLHDFRFTGSGVRSIESTANGASYMVAEYEWEGFGMAFRRYVARDVDSTAARSFFSEE